MTLAPFAEILKMTQSSDLSRNTSVAGQSTVLRWYLRFSIVPAMRSALSAIGPSPLDQPKALSLAQPG